MRTRKLLRARFLGGLLVGCAQLLGALAVAAPVTWIGGSGIWSDGDTNNANWNPADEPDIDDEAIFNTADSVTLGTANTIEALTMSGGMDLATSGFGLTVDGLAQLADTGTFLVIEGPGSAVIADSVTINSGGQIRLNGLLSISDETADGLLDINTGGTISGSGTVHLGDFVDTATILLTNDGTISALSPAPFLGAAPPVRTLAINASDVADALIDLDGGGGNAVLNVFRNQILDINVRLTDQFSGDINLFQNSVLDISTAWILDTGTIDVDNGLIDNPSPAPDIPAGIAYIRTGGLTQTGGTITVVDADGILQFDSPFTMNGGSLVNNGQVEFDADANIAAGANFTMPTSSSSITLSAGVTVSIDQANFDADGPGSATNVITVGNGGNFDLDLGAGADESLGGFIQLNGGELDVTTADLDWTIQGNVNVGANTGTSQINGDEVTMSTASIVVGENSTLQINPANIWGASGSLEVNAGGIATLNGITTFSGAGTFTGAGTLLLAGITSFDAPTTINIPQGAVDLDGNDVIGSMVTIDADTTINVGTMADFGNDNVIGFNILQLNDVASLTVNLTDPSDEWTLSADGRLDINASTTVTDGSGIYGSDFNMAGTATIDGNSLWGARTDISGTVTIAAGSRLTLDGGNLNDENLLLDGTINGPGVLGAGSFRALHGFGTIHADIDFDGDSELFAHSGTLILTGDILDARLLGTFDGDAILDVTNPWNTSVVTQVVLQGGELRGATITNDGLIRAAAGETLVTARVINDLQIFADGGDLEFETAANDNDWDGTANNGQLNAFNGDITLHDNADFEYAGTIFIGAGSELFTTGFSFESQPGSLVDITGGTWRQSANRTTEIGGEVVVNAPLESTLKTGGTTSTFQFEPTADVTLNGNLRLDSGVTRIESGASFTGIGRLINAPGRRLEASHQADIGVIVENQGLYSNSGDDAGRNDVHTFVQTTSGTFRVDVQGTAIPQFDRLQIDNQAQLSGSLELVLGGAYTPALGDTLGIISATGGVTGTFSNVVQPTSMPAGLMFDVIYNPALVQLMVIEAVFLPGDYNLNGVVDASDYVLWRDTLGQQGADLAADGNNNASIDAGDYDVWRANFGRASIAASVAADLANDATVPGIGVPEPTAAGLGLLGLAGLLLHRRSHI